MSRNFWVALLLSFVGIEQGGRGIQQGGADLWFGVVALVAVPFLVALMWREWRAAKK